MCLGSPRCRAKQFLPAGGCYFGHLAVADAGAPFIIESAHTGQIRRSLFMIYGSQGGQIPGVYDLHGR